MRDEQQLLRLRPELELVTDQSRPEEVFQNRTLRPILKMQHQLLIHLFQTHIRKRKNAYFQMSEPARLEWIADAVRSDQRFRNLLVGTIIGHFTVDELRTFEDNEAECLRRLVNLIIQRLQSEDFVCPD
jgi:hypothetical protein